MFLIAGIAGCCSGHNWYNLGAAHGHPRAKDQRAFDDWVLARYGQYGFTGIHTAVTNGEQTREREYLEHIGFVTVKAGNLWSHTISGQTLTAYVQKIRAERAAEKQVAKASVLKKEKYDKAYNGVISIEDIRAIMGPWTRGTRNTRRAIEGIREKYGVTVPVQLHDYNEDVRLRVYAAVKKMRDAEDQEFAAAQNNNQRVFAARV